MRREDVVKIVNQRLKSLQVPKHVTSVRTVPCFVEVDVLIGNDRSRLHLRSGITPPELEHKLCELAGKWRYWQEMERHQVTLDEAIAASKK